MFGSFIKRRALARSTVPLDLDRSLRGKNRLGARSLLVSGHSSHSIPHNIMKAGPTYHPHLLDDIDLLLKVGPFLPPWM
jgi:hypothetical protein